MVSKSYDIFNRIERPSIILCNPNKSETYSLKSCMNPSLTLRFNAMSELTFDILEWADGESIPAYEHIHPRKLVYVEGMGYFEIGSCPEDDSGDILRKSVVARSYEITLLRKKITQFGGTYPLYDPISPDDTLLGKIVSIYAPNWSIGSVDSSLLTKYRTFDISDSNVYSFLMNDVAEAFNCVFTFDTENNQISVLSIDDATTDTDVYFSHQNVIKTSQYNEIEDEITTALYVYGANDLDIRTVNPLGTSVIYNFDYYKSTDWMTQDLIDAIGLWESLVASKQSEYANTLTDLKIAIGELVVLEVELTDLESEYTALEGVLRVRIEQGLDLTDVNSDLDAKQTEIDNKQSEIDSKNSSITSLRTSLEDINDLLSFENNFTEDELDELNSFIFENTYQNENLEQLDSMEDDEIQELAQTLYDQGEAILEKISQPRYEYSMDTASILAIKEFDDISSQLELGSEVYVERNADTILKIVLLELSFNFDDPSEFSMTFSNRLRLDNGHFIFTDLFGKPVRVGTTVSYDKAKWSDWVNSYKNDVTNFINSSLDASLNNVISDENQEILIDSNGLRGRKYDSGTGDYEDTQVWLTSSTLAFTEDSWQTASLALGEIGLDGTPLWGVVGESVFHGEIL